MQQKDNKGLRETPKSRVGNEQYRSEWERIFGNKKQEEKKEDK